MDEIFAGLFEGRKGLGVFFFGIFEMGQLIQHREVLFFTEEHLMVVGAVEINEMVAQIL